MTIQEASSRLFKVLSNYYDEGEAQSLVRIILEDAFHLKRPFPERSFSKGELARLNAILSAIPSGKPIQYILGSARFFELNFFVNPAVLIPRMETEELIAWMLEDHPERSELKVLDIGTGSGCIPISLKRNRPEWKVWALDISPSALEVAKSNAKRHQTNITFLILDILEPSNWVEMSEFECIVSNPPYIPPSEQGIMGASVLDFEPEIALFTPEHAPLLFYDTISRFAREKLVAGGSLYFECNERNAEKVGDLLKSYGFAKVTLQKDINGKIRMVKGVWRDRK